MVRKSKPQDDKKKGNHRLRIIGGEWRGRRLEFAVVEGLRPTGERVRETLFNWLMASTPGAHCLDLFAGSGALALEALSRGAASATLIDSSRQVTDELSKQVTLLRCDRATIINQNSITWLQQQSNSQKQSNAQKQFDIVFLDPPFRQGLLAQTIALLEHHDLLKPEALIYIESECELGVLSTPSTWSLHRQKITGQVAFSLYQRTL